jgi:uncharacterized heparinase superfamily protein
MPVSAAQRIKLLKMLLRRTLCHIYWRLNGHPLLRWRFLPAKTDRLVIAPQDLRTADPTRASEIYAGHFVFGGKAVTCDGRSPFEMTPPSDEWATLLLGFGWLRHLRAAESGITRANARALVDEWIALQGAWHPVGWRAEVLARRVISWINQAPLLLHDADPQFYRRFMRSLSRQVRSLRSNHCNSRRGAARLQIVIALMYATLCMAGENRHLKRDIRRLEEELNWQILPDGGHVSRNPGLLIELLLDLLPLRQSFAARNLAPPAALLNAIDRMMPMLRFYRHGDGNFALFNGMGPTPIDQLATILAYDDARGAPLQSATHSGYQRLTAKSMLVIADVGTPPPLAVSQEAHAGCLSFELSSNDHRIVINCGMPTYNRESWREVARATAAHSTVTFNDTSSCRFRRGSSFRKLLGVPVMDGPSQVHVARDMEEDGETLRAAHDGYTKAFGVIHQRALLLSPDGLRLDGKDSFLPAQGAGLPVNVPDEFAVRFHLHPSIKASRLGDGHGVMLVLPNREVWTFDAHAEQVELEESVFLSNIDGPRRTVQIVIYGEARRTPRLYWTFAHTSAGQAEVRREASIRKAAQDEPELPL